MWPCKHFGLAIVRFLILEQKLISDDVFLICAQAVLASRYTLSLVTNYQSQRLPATLLATGLPPFNMCSL